MKNLELTANLTNSNNSLVLDTRQSGRSTLIAHIDGKEASSVAERVEAVLTKYNLIPNMKITLRQMYVYWRH